MSRIKTKWYVFGTLVLVLAVLVTSGCGPTPTAVVPTATQVAQAPTAAPTTAPTTAPTAEAATPSAEQVNITWMIGSWDESKANQLVSAFEAENPNIKVTINSIDYSDLYNKELTSLVGGTPPDLIDTITVWLLEFVDLGYVKPLNDYIGQLEWSDWAKPFQDEVTVDDQIYGVPFRAITYAMVYNKDLFEAAGLDPEKPPTTIAELRDYAKKLTDPAAGVYGYALVGSNKFAGHVTAQVMPFVWDAGGDILSADKTKITISDPKAEAGIQEWADFLLKDKSVSPAAVTLDNEQTAALFGEGKLAMVYNGLYVFNYMRDQGQTINWGVAETPGVPLARTLSQFIPDQAAHPDAAWKLLMFVNRPENQAFYTDDMPTRNAAFQDPLFTSRPQTLPFMSQLNRAQLSPNCAGWAEIEGVWVNALDSVLDGSKTVQEAFDAAAPQMQDILDKAIKQ